LRLSVVNEAIALKDFLANSFLIWEMSGFFGGVVRVCVHLYPCLKDLECGSFYSRDRASGMHYLRSFYRVE
jgi:hypothetical protein